MLDLPTIRRYLREHQGTTHKTFSLRELRDFLYDLDNDISLLLRVCAVSRHNTYIYHKRLHKAGYFTDSWCNLCSRTSITPLYIVLKEKELEEIVAVEAAKIILKKHVNLYSELGSCDNETLLKEYPRLLAYLEECESILYSVEGELGEALRTLKKLFEQYYPNKYYDIDEFNQVVIR